MLWGLCSAVNVDKNWISKLFGEILRVNNKNLGGHKDVKSCS